MFMSQQLVILLRDLFVPNDDLPVVPSAGQHITVRVQTQTIDYLCVRLQAELLLLGL